MLQHAARKLRTMSGLNEITHFGDMSSLTGRSGNADVSMIYMVFVRIKRICMLIRAKLDL